MMSNRGRDTAPELALRSLLHRSGLRFRVDHPLPFDRRRRADIVFTRVGLYVFVDGCFWHGCPQHFVMPKTRTEFWQQKIETNRRRDNNSNEQLRARGLTSLRVWEHTSPAEAATMVQRAYRNRSSESGDVAKLFKAQARSSAASPVTAADPMG